ncbi:hypothetical protein BDF19DRAFT_450749 [Syncephalis fuscata]|nr:hypothetical protein BDF19DRAFT_450749 [Syncephalis fuscata]
MTEQHSLPTSAVLGNARPAGPHRPDHGRPPLLVRPTSRPIRSKQPTSNPSPFEASNTHHSSRDYSSTSHAVTEFEYSVHGTNGAMHDELTRVFPFEQLSATERDTRRSNLKIIMTFQRCRNDLVGIGPQVELEKDERLETFFQMAEYIHYQLNSRGYWVDFTDPSSGYPVYSPRGSTYFPDVVATEILLGYDVLWTGCCKVLVHPRWDAKVYPASLFTDAPIEDIQQVIDDACGHRSTAHKN